MTANRAAPGSIDPSPTESSLTPEQRTDRLVAAIGELSPERARRIVALLAAGAASSRELDAGHQSAA